MGAALSTNTVVGWTLILAVGGFFIYQNLNTRRVREASKAASQRQKGEPRQNPQPRKENKPKRQRAEAYNKAGDDSDKTAVAAPKPKAPKATNTAPVDYSTDDGVDNREFARQLANAQQGTVFSGPKKAEEKKQKSVKQSRAREIEPKVEAGKLSAPSSTAGIDADDDQSSVASPEVTAADSRDVSDMLEPSATSGPAVLRLTDTDKVKDKKKAAKAPEKKETKKQRQNHQKAQAAKEEREAQEAERKKLMEAQRRRAREAEGRAAQDGSGFMAARAANSAWLGNGANGLNGANGANGGLTNGGLPNGQVLPVQPLDTFESGAQTDTTTKSSAPSVDKTDSWVSPSMSEEEQIALIQEDEAWSTVKTKKATKGKKADTKNEVPEESNMTRPLEVTPVVSKPAVMKATPAPTNGRPTKPALGQQSSFAALSAKDEPDVEEEWDV